MTKRAVQRRDVFPQPAKHFHISESGLHFHLHHIVNKVLIGSSLRPAEQQLDRFPMLADVVHHPLHIVAGGFSHVRRLLLFRQLGKAGLGFHEPAH